MALQDLFDLPITGELSLNAIGRAINKEIDVEKHDLVTSSSARQKELKFQLSIITDVIDTKFKLANKAKLNTEQQARRKALTKALEVKRMNNLSEMSEEDILKELDSMR